MTIRVLRLNLDSLLGKLHIIRDYYLCGDLVIIKNFKPKSVNTSLIEDAALAVSTDLNDPSIKKGHAGGVSRACEPFDKSRQLKLKLQMSECENIVRKLFIALLSRPDGTSTACHNGSTWRFTPTHCEPYHLDDYRGTVLRAFWNLSDKPRIWRIGHSALDIARMHKDAYVNFINRNRLLIKTCSDFQCYSNRYLGYKARKIEDADKYQISFKKYELWICDSLKACHEIVSGDKMAAFSFVPSDPSGFYDPKTLDRLEYKSWIIKGLRLPQNRI